MFTIFGHRNFTLFWFGYFISTLGNLMLQVALPFYVYQRTGSALATGATYIVENIPPLLFGSLAGVFVDRWNRRWTLVVTEILSALLLLPLLFVQARNDLWLVYVVAFSEAIIALFINPASGALVPHLVKEDQLISANSAIAFGQEMARLIGPTLGGFFLGFFGLSNVIIADSFSFLCCGMFILFVYLPPVETSASTVAHTDKVTNILREWLGGLHLVRQEYSVTILFIVASFSMIGTGFAVIFIPFLHDVVHVSPITFGWVLTVQGLGGVIGSLINERLNKKISLPLLIALSGILLGLFNLLIIAFPLLFVVLLVYVVGGGPVIFFFTGIYTLLQQSVSDAYRGRIFGMYNTVNTASLLIGMSLCSVLAASLGSRLLFGLMGLFYFLAGVIALGTLRIRKANMQQDLERIKESV